MCMCVCVCRARTPGIRRDRRGMRRGPKYGQIKPPWRVSLVYAAQSLCVGVRVCVLGRGWDEFARVFVCIYACVYMRARV